MLKIHIFFCIESEWPNEGPCLRDIMNRNRQMRDLFRINDESAVNLLTVYDKPESPKEGACLRYRYVYIYIYILYIYIIVYMKV